MINHLILLKPTYLFFAHVLEEVLLLLDDYF